jgi:hypothetical protein
MADNKRQSLGAKAGSGAAGIPTEETLSKAIGARYVQYSAILWQRNVLSGLNAASG